MIETLALVPWETARPYIIATLVCFLSAGLDPVRADLRLARGRGRYSQNRLGKYRRDQCAAHGQALGRSGDIAGRRRPKATSR